MNYLYKDIASENLKKVLLRDKIDLYVFRGKTSHEALKKLHSYTARNMKSWRKMRYNQLMAIDKERQNLGLNKIHFTE